MEIAVDEIAVKINEILSNREPDWLIAAICGECKHFKQMKTRQRFKDLTYCEKLMVLRSFVRNACCLYEPGRDFEADWKYEDEGGLLAEVLVP